jgi:hypothetical protein
MEHRPSNGEITLGAAADNQCLGQPFAMTAAMTFLVHLTHMLRAPGQTPLKLVLAPDAQAPETRMPDSWRSPTDGDGRARQGRDRVWVVAEVVLAVKVRSI